MKFFQFLDSFFIKCQQNENFKVRYSLEGGTITVDALNVVE
jgi:hypothetical protein